MTIHYSDGEIHINDHSELVTRKDWRQLTADIYKVPTDYRSTGYFIGYYAHGEPREMPACGMYTYIGSVTIPANDDALLERSKQDALDRLNDIYMTCVAVLEADYPPSERESWHVQVDEAKRLQDGDEDTPWIDAAASGRGITREELANLILQQDSHYRVMHGALTGRRQAIRDLILACTSIEELESINIEGEYQNDFS